LHCSPQKRAKEIAEREARDKEKAAKAAAEKAKAEAEAAVTLGHEEL